MRERESKKEREKKEGDGKYTRNGLLTAADRPSCSLLLSTCHQSIAFPLSSSSSRSLLREANKAKKQEVEEMAKKSASAPKAAAKKGSKKSHRKPKRTWNVYINRS